jgi:hypothetical protein
VGSPATTVGVPADQRHEQRDQRQGDQHDDGAGQVGAEQVDQHHHRHHHREHQLRQVAGQVGVQRFDPGGGQDGEPPGLFAGSPAGTQRGRVQHQIAPQPGGDRRRTAPGQFLRRPGQPGADRDHHGQHPQAAGDLFQAGPADDHLGQDPGQQDGLDDHHQRRQNTQDHGQHDQPAHAGGVPGQSRVEGSHGTSETERSDSRAAAAAPSPCGCRRLTALSTGYITW